ncbi:MAG: copper-binding protein [Hyphomicrobiales bacterium]|nr:copper-binding protein [Hyphomicrobiales bacterium]
MKKTIRSISAAAALAASLTLTGHAAWANEPVWTKGEVTKVDKELGKVTIRHEEITNLEMPPMRMIFRVADPTMLEQLAAGQKGEFYFVDENGRMMIKQIKQN